MLQKQRAIGVILDLTLRHTKDDIRVVDVIKKCLINFVRGFDDDDILYLYDEMKITSEHKRGRQVHAVASYTTDGFEFDLYYALKQTLYVLQAEDQDFDKVIYIINDRVRNPSYFNKIVALNIREGSEVEFVLITSQPLTVDGMRVVNFQDPIDINHFLEQENHGDNTFFIAKWT